MDILKILRIVGIVLQFSAGGFFLLRNLGIKLEDIVERRSDKIRRSIENPKIATAIIFITILCMVTLFFFVSSWLTGQTLSNMGTFNLIGSIIVAFMMASGLYAISLRAALRIAEKTGINVRLSRGTQSIKFIRRNLFLFIISAIIALVFLAIFNLTKQLTLIDSISALLFIAFSSVAVLSFFLSLVFTIAIFVAKYFSKPKRFFTALFIMWVVGGACLLISAFYT